MNYGHFGRDLLLELKRSSTEVNGGGSASTPALLPPYNDTLVGNALQDLRLHVEALQDQVEAASSSNRGGDGTSGSSTSSNKPSMSVRPSILLQNAAIQRNKRCLLAYHVERLHRIQQGLYWQQIPQESKQLCPAEEDFLSSYSDLIQQYTNNIGLGDIDNDFLRSNAVPPLVSNERVQVRVLNPVGDGTEVALESGATANFTMVGSTHYLLWNDVEEYVRSGHLKVVDGEEQVG